MASETTPADNFGANDWLMDEMRELWKQDPEAVDVQWATLFKTEQQPAASSASPAAPSQPVTTPAAQPRPASPPAAVPAKPGAAAGTATVLGNPSAGSVNKSTPPAAAATKTVQQPPASTAAPKPVKAEAPKPAKPVTVGGETRKTVLKGAPMRTARNMEASLTVPTATTVRSVPMKLMIEIRSEINTHLKRNQGGKISFTHLIAYAMVQAIKAVPAMNNAFEEIDGKPTLIENSAINLGIAIDVKKPDGSRTLVVPNIKGAQAMKFSEFLAAYEELIAKGRTNALTVDDFAGTTCSITNPGGIGTNHSVPRLMGGQAFILGVGNVDYPAEFAGCSQTTLDDMAVSKITTFTSTYDHRVIQGAQSGEFLKKLHGLLLGEDNFYDAIYESLRVPYPPLRWAPDITPDPSTEITKQSRVLQLIEAYRTWGHLMANIDPLVYKQRSDIDLELGTHGLTLWDLDRHFAIGALQGKKLLALPLRQTLEILRDAYCRAIAVEYMYIADPQERSWFQNRVEKPHTPLPQEDQLRVLDRLNEAEVFETFLQTKFVGQKRFSLEGGEGTIVALDAICEEAADRELDEVCIGMPHRGRLNVLANIVGKSYGQIFREFNDQVMAEGTGDVKYHLGAEGQFTAASGNVVRTSVAANPSHLEAVNPVLEGIVRAKQDALNSTGFPVLPILLHGDSSFAGQGINFEVMQMANLDAYKTGGTIHIVVNNQVGFTTSPTDARSTTYCTDVAKAFQVPVFHVNGDDPEAITRVARMAFDYREQFHRDIVIDIVCYRRRGHNEGDDPSFTQPVMYDLIEAKRSVRKLYTEALVGRGDISQADADAVQQKFRQRLETVFQEVRDNTSAPDEYTRVPYYPAKPNTSGGTGITQEVLARIADAQVAFPEGFTPHPKVAKQLERRRQDILNGPVDWATAELLAFGSLVMEGRPVRITGQDSRRGTFSQRFAAIVDRETAKYHVPLQHLSNDQASFKVYDSFLSEYAVMGFEYGYSVAMPDALVLWEAQFGDFANGAQTIADEFISSGKAKWGQNSGVVLLLPHGHEGQGPDHSSARIERWLQLCSEGALAVCQPSTSASYFHLLRTHAYVNWHRPVVIATPKSMLRSKQAASDPREFVEGSWCPALGDPTITDPSKVTRVLLCSGKVRWELVNRRAQLGLDDSVAIIALERLYPLPTKDLVEELRKYEHVTDIRWVQEEPENQGAWYFLAVNLPPVLEAELGRKIEIIPVARPTASAPSVGSHHVHDAQEAALLDGALGE